MEIWNKLKERWGVETNFQVIVILLVFSLTGFSTLYAHNFIDYLLGVNNDTQLWIKTVIFIFLVLPIFSLFLSLLLLRDIEEFRWRVAVGCLFIAVGAASITLF